MIVSDAEYEKEYTRFVQAMSYQKTNERASMSDVISHFLLIVERLSTDERDEGSSGSKKAFLTHQK